MDRSDALPIISVVGRKNSGKTTFVVALAAELKRRGLRIASVKHGHHEMEIDQPGRDSWRHFHEGEVEAVMLVSAGKVALVLRDAEEPDPETLIDRFFGGQGLHLVLVEGYKHGPFPKIEIFRRTVHDRPIYDADDVEAAALYLALLTDDPELQAVCPVIPLDPTDAAGSHVRAAADLICSHLPGSSAIPG